jgi:hypothetical protein
MAIEKSSAPGHLPRMPQPVLEQATSISDSLNAREYSSGRGILQQGDEGMSNGTSNIISLGGEVLPIAILGYYLWATHPTITLLCVVAYLVSLILAMAIDQVYQKEAKA